MESLLLSIVIPVYNEIDRNNGEERIRRCLDKILAQDCRDIEIICIDDHSKDKSLELLMEYKNKWPNIIVLHNESNNGLGYSRNKGIRNSQGKYIWFVDADDYIDPVSIEIIREIVIQNPLDVLCFDMKYVREEGEEINHLLAVSETEIKPGHELYSEILSGNCLRASACGQIYRKQYLQEKKIEFTEGTIAEDMFFSMRALIGAPRAKYIQKVLYIYHRNFCSITTKTLDRDYFIGNFVAYCNIFNFFYFENFGNALNEHITKVMSQRYNIAKDHFNTCDKKDIDLWMEEHADQAIYKQYQLFITKEIEGIYLKNIKQEKLKIIKQYEDCIVYGAGVVAKEVTKMLNKMEQHIVAYAVSENAGDNPKNIYGVPVITINNLVEYRKSALVIISVLPKKYDAIENILNKLGFLHVLKLLS